MTGEDRRPPAEPVGRDEAPGPDRPRTSAGVPAPSGLRRAPGPSPYARFRSAYHEFAVHNPARHGAALAYYGLFSLIPVLAIGVQLVRRLLSEEARAMLVEGLASLGGLLGPDALAAIEQQVEETARRVGTGSAVVTVTALLVVLYTASGAFTQLKYSLNTIWGVPHETQLRARSMIATRLMGFALVLGVGFLLVLAVIANILVGSLGAMLGAGSLARFLNALVSLFLIAASFACLYKLLPDAPVTWPAAWAGAGVAAVGGVAALSIATLYFRYVQLNTTLSVAGGLAVLLIMTNYLAQVFLFGAVVSRRSDRLPEGPMADDVRAVG